MSKLCVVKQELNFWTKLPVYWVIHVPNRTYGHDLCVVMANMRIGVQAGLLGLP